MAKDARTGTLYVVATPIGNLGDIGARAATVLRRVAMVAAEDTRRSRVLLAEIGAAPAEILSLADHNEAQRTARVLRRLEAGDDVALVSDAGTPLVSDPGFELVRAAHERDIAVVPIPGPSAVIAALSVCPLPVNRFRFEGFLPVRPAARRRRLSELAHLDVSLVCFESARRLADVVTDVVDLLGPERPMFLAKELTKVHERLVAGRAAELAHRLETESELAIGEFVVVIAPAPASDELTDEGRRLVRVLCEELTPAQAARLAAKFLDVPKSTLYEYALSRKRADE
jgi:16S rRNA (cytidine1402-2'-O)-methyltransferase